MAGLGKNLDEIFVALDHWQQMQRDVESHAPLEACGIVAGREMRSLAVFPTPNILISSSRFRMDPREQLRIFLQLEDKGWELIAIYHSHPQGPSIPSVIDVAEAFYPDAVHLIWSPGKSGWACRAFRIEDGQVSEIHLRIIEDR